MKNSSFLFTIVYNSILKMVDSLLHKYNHIPEEVLLFADIYLKQKMNQFIVFCLNKRKQIIANHVFPYSEHNKHIDYKEIFKSVVSDEPEYLILFHLYPKPLAGPKLEDSILVNNFNKICEIIEINLIDHLVMAPDSLYSTLHT